MKEFALIFRLNDTSDFKPSPEQMQERMNWLGHIAAQYTKIKAINHYQKAIELTKSKKEKQTLKKEIERIKEKIYLTTHS